MKNNGFYLNFVLTMLLVSLVVFGLAFVTSIDRLRFQMEEIRRTVSEIKDKQTSPMLPRTAVPSAASAPVSNAANAEFYAPDAESGGRIITAIAADTGNLNMIVNNDATVSTFWSKCTDSLAERNWKNIGEFQPMLAESWTESPDHKVYRIKLRKGILWHDFTDPVTGRKWKNAEVTAEDFKFYVDVIKDENVDAAPLRGYLAALREIRVLGRYEFEAVWDKPYFLAREITLGLSPLPRHLYHAYPGPFDGKRFNTDDRRNRILVGCGPYRLASWEKGKRVLLKRFDNYYGKPLGIMPSIPVLAYDLIQHPNTRLQALISRDLDMDNLSPEQWILRTDGEAFAEAGGWLRKIKYPAFAYNYIGLNLTNPLFADRKVRVALSHLVDRARILKDVYHNLARPVSGPFFVDSPATDRTIKPYSFSVTEAKRLLAEAGWSDRNGDGVLEKDGRDFRFTLMYPNVNKTYQKILPILKEDMAKAGIRLEILALEWSVMIQRIEKKAFEATILGWTSTITPDPFQLWHSSTVPLEGSSNFVSFRNAEADRLIEQIRTTFDESKRIELYHRFHKLIHDEAPYLFLFSPYNLLVLNRRYRNVRVFPLGVPDNILWVPRAEQLRVPGL